MDGCVTRSIVAAKVRVAMTISTSIPHLELMAAVFWGSFGYENFEGARYFSKLHYILVRQCECSVVDSRSKSSVQTICRK